MSTTFAELGVPAQIARALEDRGITAPFAIQAATISDGLDGHDVCGRAPTGSGKTIAFGVPLVANSRATARPKQPTALVLAPTRELADQIHAELASFAGEVRVGVAYGGVGYGKQFEMLRRGVEILVACPGRLEDLISQGEVDLSRVSQVVLDEADRMADMGFIPAVRRLLDQTSNERQTVLFSATLDGDVAKLTREYQTEPVTHTVGDDTPDIQAAHHRFWEVEKTDRAAVTARIVEVSWPAIVFTRTRHGADRLAKQLNRAGVDAAPIHGGRSQNQRTRALGSFSDGTVQALVATDVAARGIHVDNVACVVHFDPPEDHKTYIHRSGRTARAGQTGVVVSLVQPDQRKDVRSLQRQIGLEEAVAAPAPDSLRQLAEQPPRRRLSTSSGTDSSAGSPSSKSNRNGSTPRQNKGKRKRSGPQRSAASGKGSQGHNGSRSAGKGPRSNGAGGKPSSGGQQRNGQQRGGKGQSAQKNRGGGQRSGGGSSNGSPRRRTRSGPKR